MEKEEKDEPEIIKIELIIDGVLKDNADQYIVFGYLVESDGVKALFLSNDNIKKAHGHKARVEQVNGLIFSREKDHHDFFCNQSGIVIIKCSTARDARARATYFVENNLF
jgi:hypothetical protein